MNVFDQMRKKRRGLPRAGGMSTAQQPSSTATTSALPQPKLFNQSEPEQTSTNTGLPAMKYSAPKPVAAPTPAMPEIKTMEAPKENIAPALPQPMQTPAMPDIKTVEAPKENIAKVIPQPMQTPSMPDIQTMEAPVENVEPYVAQADNTGYDNTQIGTQAMDKFSEYALADEDPQVTAERDRLDRNNLLRVEQSRRTAHENAVRAGFQPGSAQYEQMMRDTVSSAENQGISATNSFNDFARGRRSDQQRELEGLAEGEFSRIGTQESRDWNEFNNMVKFLPSDKAQQMLAISKATGVDVPTAIAGMYDESGNIKPEFADLSQSELVKQGMEQAIGQMTNNPDTGVPWAGNEQAEFIDKFYSENFQNIIDPSGTQSDIRDEKDESKSRIQKALDLPPVPGSLSNLTAGDWNNMTDTQILDAKEKGHISDYDAGAQGGDNWKDLDNMETDDAMNHWLKNNPISSPINKGKIVEKNGVLYEITEPMKIVDLGGDNKRISVMAIPVKGGPEISLKNSDRFEGTVGAFLDDLLPDLNPFN